MAVHIDRDGPVTTICIDRPEARNAVDRATADALVLAFEAFDADPDARVGVLTGEGGTFCAGADLKAIAAGAPNRLDPYGAGPMGPTRMLLKKPVIAAIEGHAVAGGLELALWCDLRVLAEDAVLGVFCRRFGVPLIDGGTVRLPRIVGLGRALDLILTGRPVGSAEALHIGLATKVVPAGSALCEARALAATLARLPQAALRADRESALRQYALPLREALGLEFELGSQALPEAAEGAARFVEGAGRGGVATGEG